MPVALLITGYYRHPKMVAAGEAADYGDEPGARAGDGRQEWCRISHAMTLAFRTARWA